MVQVGCIFNSFPALRGYLMKNIIALVVFSLCLCWTCNLQAENGGKTVHILYSADERGAITPCG